MRRLTILDDYQQVALSTADWSVVAETFRIEALGEYLADQDALVARLADSEVIVAMRERTAFPAELLRRLPNLRLLVTTGMRNAAIDVAAAKELGITVCGTGAKGTEMPELVLGMMIALTRNFVAEDRAVRDGGWQHTVGMGLHGNTLGVFGLGRLGAPVAKLALAFGMRVLAWSPNLTAERAAEHGATAVGKTELFAESDIVTVHMPLAEGTRGLIGAAELGAMKPTGYLINTSRGPIVDEAALVAALRENRIAGAGLDVYDREPLPVDHVLRTLPNTLLLPHIGYVTTDSYAVYFQDAVADVLGYLNNAPLREL